MKIKMKELVDNYLSLEKLSKVNLVKLGLTYKQIKKIIILLKKAKEEIIPYDKVKLDLLTKYGKRDDQNPSNFNILIKNLEIFNKELDELHAQEIEIKYEKIKLVVDVKKLDNLNIDDLIKLELFFDME
jgi:hypothetical protein